MTKNREYSSVAASVVAQKRISSPTLSIIIPMLNEAAYIGRLLEYVQANSTASNIQEIIVVDGGSSDDSVELVSEFQEVRLLHATIGRARQLNYGASVARGDILYFLHADSFPPKDFDRKILYEVNQSNTGCFRLRFENPDHLLLQLSQWFTRFNFSLFRGGDQSLFITQENFESLNGFDERFMIYEDIELINRIYKKYKFSIIKDYVITAERKFRKNGIWKLHFNFLMIHLKSWLGASPENLYTYYLKSIQD